VIVVLSLRLQDTSNGATGPAGDPHQLLAAFSVVPLSFLTPQCAMLPPNAFFWKIGIGLVTRTPVARRISSAWATIESVSVPDDVLNRASALFQNINQRFAQFEPRIIR
jgi:hypothetical protein